MNTASNGADRNLEPALPEQSERGYPFRKLVISLFMLAMLWLTFWAAVFVSVAQFVLRAFDSDASSDLTRFGGRLGMYMGELVGYITFARDAAPFPFSSFPKG